MNEDNQREITERIENSFRRCFGIITEIKNTDQQRWRDQVGPLLDEMLTSRPAAESFLQHPSSVIRLVSLQVLTYHWPFDLTVAEKCITMAAGDTDPDVVLQAIASLGVWYVGTDDLRIGKLLAEIIASDAQPNSLRTVAYFSLLLLSGDSDQRAEDAVKASRSLQFPEDIKQAVVDRYLDSNH